jgi:uncharacterized protein (DUF1810 family)
MSDDPFELERFVRRQALDYDTALAELRAGQKRTHWMWYTFPQLDGLGKSFVAKRYAIRSLDEARAYLAHPILGPRLIECCEALLVIPDKTALEILGTPDDLKLRSCVTLFGITEPCKATFGRVLERYFNGARDVATLDLLERSLRQ